MGRAQARGAVELSGRSGRPVGAAIEVGAGPKACGSLAPRFGATTASCSHSGLLSRAAGQVPRPASNALQALQSIPASCTDLSAAAPQPVARRSPALPPYAGSRHLCAAAAPPHQPTSGAASLGGIQTRRSGHGHPRHQRRPGRRCCCSPGPRHAPQGAGADRPHRRGQDQGQPGAGRGAGRRNHLRRLGAGLPPPGHWVRQGARSTFVRLLLLPCRAVA